jgi:hypothetical protein
VERYRYQRVHRCVLTSNVRRQLIVLDTSFNLELVNGNSQSLGSAILTVSMEACKKLRASRPTQTLSIEKSPPRIIEEPLCVPSCRRIGSALSQVSGCQRHSTQS